MICGLRVDIREAVTALHPFRDGDAQAGRAERGRIIGEAAQIFRERALDELGRRVLGLADVQADAFEFGRGRDRAGQGGKLLKRITLQLVEARIHARRSGLPGACRGMGFILTRLRLLSAVVQGLRVPVHGFIQGRIIKVLRCRSQK